MKRIRLWWLYRKLRKINAKSDYIADRAHHLTNEELMRAAGIMGSRRGELHRKIAQLEFELRERR